MDFKIDEMKPSDWTQVCNIYLEGINTKIATFQTEIPSWDEWNKSHCSFCRLVAKSEDKIFGWASLSPISNRCVYKGVSEVSIYIGESYKGQGVGFELLMNIINQSEENGFWTLQSGIIKENIASRELHKKCGFREIGIREKLGKMDNGKWHDVVLMERRSKLVGTN